MRAAVIKEPGLDNLVIEERDEPTPGPGEVLVRIRACSINYRDLLTVNAGYGSRQKSNDLVPLSDGAGEVTAVGDGVAKFKPGDRVTASFFQSWIAGGPTEERFAGNLGGALDGVLQEYRVFPEHGLVRTPDSLTDQEAACLPCAGLTAWSAVITQGQVQPGDIVLTQGTGGVSLFALQFAKLAGAQVIATSSSDAKLEKVKALGADRVINYKSDPDWGKTARALTGGRGVDHVVEVGGAGTLKQSMRAVRGGGAISMIGVLSGAGASDLNVALVVMSNTRLQGVTVGSREMLEDMARAMDLHGTKPVIDQAFPMANIRDAFAHMQAGAHFGKIVIDL